MKNFLIYFVNFYKRFISPILPRSCRYYPTCSEYALQELKFANVFEAIFKIIFRILRCNQLFKGGIDYPIVKRNFNYSTLKKYTKTKPIFWFIPYKKNKFYLIKVFDSLKEK